MDLLVYPKPLIHTDSIEMLEMQHTAGIGFEIWDHKNLLFFAKPIGAQVFVSFS